jgi:recombination protein RecT
MTVAKRVTGAKEIFAEVVYEDDVFKFRIDRGNTIILEHSRELKNIDKAKIVAAYCSVILPDSDVPYTGLMTIAQIHQAWAKSQNNPISDNGQVKAGSVHGQFAEEMAKKTVTNRTCKALINSSMDDSLGLVVESVNRMDDAAEEAAFAAEVAEHANSEFIDAEYTEAPAEELKAAPEQAEQPDPAAKPAAAAKGKKQPEPDW